MLQSLVLAHDFDSPSHTRSGVNEIKKEWYTDFQETLSKKIHRLLGKKPRYEHHGDEDVTIHTIVHYQDVSPQTCHTLGAPHTRHTHGAPVPHVHGATHPLCMAICAAPQTRAMHMQHVTGTPHNDT